MTPRERVLAVLNGQKPDLVPRLSDLDYWATALIGRGDKTQDFKQSDALMLPGLTVQVETDAHGASVAATQGCIEIT